MVMILIALPVLLLLLLGTVEIGMRVYYKAQVHSAATAAALAAVGTQTHWPIPIPTKWVMVGPVPIPVDGIFINTLHLPNVDWHGRAVVDEAKTVGEWTGPGPKITLSADTIPLWIPSPFKYVAITAEVEPPSLFSKLFGQAKVTDRACAVAWIRPDYWYHTWWKDGEKSLVTLGVKSEPFRYYRLVPCGAPGLADALEIVIEAHLETTGEAKGDEMRQSRAKVEANATRIPQNQQSLERTKNAKDDKQTLAPTGDQVAESLREGTGGPPSSRQPEPGQVECPDGSAVTVPMLELDDPSKAPTEAELAQQYCPPPPPPEKEESP